MADPNLKHDHIKWFTLGFLSALGVIALVIVILFYSFTPLMKFDETTGRLQLLGGLIDLQAHDVITQLSKDNSFVFGTIEGVENVPAEAQAISVKFGAGQMRIDYNTTNEMNWDCDGAGKNARAEMEDGTMKLDFSSAFVDCDVSLPVRRVRVEGASGEVEVRKIQADLEIKLGSGEIHLQPLNDRKYQYELKVVNGNVDDSLSSEDSPNKSGEKALPPIKVKAEVKIGSIERLD